MYDPRRDRGEHPYVDIGNTNEAAYFLYYPLTPSKSPISNEDLSTYNISDRRLSTVSPADINSSKVTSGLMNEHFPHAHL